MTEALHVDTSPPQRLELLDYLRFIAAAAVLLFHYFAKGIEAGRIVGIEQTSSVGWAKYGYLGVHLFFLISGFVILRSAQGRSARSFAVHRAVRLYPAFWVAVIATAAVTALWGGGAGLSVSPSQVVVNLTMAPGVFNVTLVDGVYWTLLLELYFYLAIFVLLLLGQARRLGAWIPWWVFVQFAVLMVTPQWTSVIYLGNSFVLFSLGALISEIFGRGVTLTRSLALVLGIYMACEWGTRSVDSEAVKGLDYSSPVLVTVTLACVTVLMMAASKRVGRLRLPKSQQIGALTYPLYLLHAHIGFIALSRGVEFMPVWLDYVVVIVGVLVLSYLVHVVVEQRPRLLWRRFFDRTVGRTVDVMQMMSGRTATTRD